MKDIRDTIIGVGIGLLWALPLTAIGAAIAWGAFATLLRLFGLWG